MTTTQDRPVEERPAPAGMSEESRQLARDAVRSTLPFKVMGTFGDFYGFVGTVFKQMFTRKFHFREFISQAWFITTVSFWPAMLVSIPFCVVIIFQVNQLLIQIGAVDLAGAGAAVAVVREIGPIVSVLVVAGAGATAVCADLGSRKIREEIDAMVTLGIDPIERLVVPRVVASMLVGLALNGMVTMVGLTGGYFFSVVLQGATPGLYLSDLTLLVGLPDFLASEAKALVFGLLAGLTACYLGLNAKGGPKGVGDAVNQTVVFSFMLLFAANSVISALFLQIKLGA
ncbi:phospholipid/cholesterol/gamma-HCH transport system permease protein [Nocardioides sp. J9]|uniref:MlaE family ABC transporter permease n=1 Tax=Nocardioides sp. J54 TaxID=935866 RepID=UPI0004910986|nr:ABC transporter permease [Nocardioides sp. J54]TWG91549.1 phospholipid/cholesterol/gamma-HCH transport system permease protein [Nocardioides sp. J9]